MREQQCKCCLSRCCCPSQSIGYCGQCPKVFGTCNVGIPYQHSCRVHLRLSDLSQYMATRPQMTAHMSVKHLCIPSQCEVVFFSFSKAAKGPAALSCPDLDFCRVVDQLFWPDSPTSANCTLQSGCPQTFELGNAICSASLMAGPKSTACICGGNGSWQGSSGTASSGREASSHTLNGAATGCQKVMRQQSHCKGRSAEAAPLRK